MAKDKNPNKKVKAPSTQQFVPIKEIREGVVIMKDSSLRSVLMISSVNFALKSEEEKNAIIASYQNFLNSLGFDIQIYIKSRKLYLDNYLDSLQKQYDLQTNELLKLQISQYIDFVSELLQSSNVMEKRFFLIVPFYPNGLEKTNVFKNLISPDEGGKVKTDFETQKMELMERVDRTISGLSGIGVRVAALNTEELIELYYSVYNPDTAGTEKIRDANNLESPIIMSQAEGGSNAR